MQTHLRFCFDRLSPPKRSSRLRRAARDQLSSIGRRWSRGLLFRSVKIPEMLDQAASGERIGEICRVIVKAELRVRTIPLGGLVIPI
jgi:hypothetical protein